MNTAATTTNQTLQRTIVNHTEALPPATAAASAKTWAAEATMKATIARQKATLAMIAAEQARAIADLINKRICTTANRHASL